MDIKDKSLREALGAAACRELPKEWREGRDALFWIKAIVLVRKRNNTQSYALAERRGDGLITYVKDFGLMSQITGLVAIYPYMYLDEGRYLNFRSMEDMKRTLSSYYGSGRREEILHLDDTGLKVLARDMAIDLQNRCTPSDVENDALSGMNIDEGHGSDKEVACEDGGNAIDKETVRTEEGIEDVKTFATSRDRKSKSGMKGIDNGKDSK